MWFMEMKLLKNLLFTTGTLNLVVAKNHYKKRSAVASRQHQGKIKCGQIHTTVLADRYVMTEQTANKTDI